MKKMAISIILLLCFLEVLFIGVPIPYNYQTYKSVEPSCFVSHIRFVFRIQPTNVSYFLKTIPLNKGNPYNVHIAAFHDISRDKSFSINSLQVINNTQISDIAMDTHRYVFNGNNFSYNIRSGKPLILSYNENEIVSIKIGIDIYDSEKKISIEINKDFVAIRDKGWMFISIMDLYMAAG